MRRVLLVALPVGLAILSAAFLFQSSRAAADAYEARLERARVKREFAERAGTSRAIPPEDAAAWHAEVAALARGYLDALAAIRDRHPTAPRAPSALAAAEAEKKGKLADKERAAIEDFQKYAEGRFALLQGGGYAPFAAALAGGLRLDLVAMEPGASPEGTPGLRIDFALWGAPRLTDRERTGDKIVSRTFVPVSLKRLGFRFLDAAGKPYGEMSGSGEPYQKLIDPERFVEDFPPGVLFGTWWVELFPREATTLELAVDADVRGAAGTSRPAAFAFTLPIREAWKLPPGVAFQGEVREVATEPAAGR